MTGEITAAISAFTASATYDDVPAAVRQRAGIHILDSLGLALAGAVSPVAGIVRDWLADQEVTGRGSTIFGTRLRAPPRFAAHANAASIHADNYDDTSPQADPGRTGGIHASAVVLPTALAVGETRRCSGADVVMAYLVGVEVASRLNHAMAPRHYADGFHVTGTLGIFGAATAASRLMGLDPGATAHALGIAASRAGGVRRNFGTMTEILHPAHAAEDGIAAAELALRGVTAAPDALDGPGGYIAAAGGGADTTAIVDKLAAPWVFEDPGVWIKPHPSGALAHPAAACLLDLMNTAGISAADIATIRARTNHRIVNTLLAGLPRNPTEARFSMAFILAVIAIEGRAGLAEFTDAVLRRADVRAMMARVEHTAFDREVAGFTNVTSFVSVDTKDGRRLEGRVDGALGSTLAPFTIDDATAKFGACAAHGGHPPEKTAMIPALVAALDRQENLERLCEAMWR